MLNLLALLTITDILIALVLAAIFTWIINRIAELVIIYKAPDLQQVLNKCYDLFPEEILQFHGETYRRGMNIRLVTNQKKILEGEFLGFGNDNMICIMTTKYIIAYALTNIEKMEKLESDTFK